MKISSIKFIIQNISWAPDNILGHPKRAQVGRGHLRAVDDLSKMSPRTRIAAAVDIEQDEIDQEWLSLLKTADIQADAETAVPRHLLLVYKIETAEVDASGAFSHGR